MAKKRSIRIFYYLFYQPCLFDNSGANTVYLWFVYNINRLERFIYNYNIDNYKSVFR